MSHPPTVSVLVPTYNAEKTIRRALSSILAQTLQPLEIIVVDDGSVDKTVPIAKELACQLRPGFLKIVELHSNHGPGYARNVGWNIASGQFLAFLDADDSWHPNKLQIIVPFMLANSELALTGHRCLRLSENDPLPVLPKKWVVKTIYGWQLMMFGRFLLTTSVVMVKREIPYRFNASKHYSEDRLLWLQILLNGQKAVHLNLPLAYIYKAPYGEAGLSRHLWEMEKGELDIFFQLRQMGFLNRCQEIALKGWSLLKYLRRVVVCWKCWYVA